MTAGLTRIHHGSETCSHVPAGATLHRVLRIPATGAGVMEEPRRAHKEKLGFLGMKHTRNERGVCGLLARLHPIGSGIGPELTLA